MAFSVALKGLQKDQVNRQCQRRTFSYTQLAQQQTHSSLLHMQTHVQLLGVKPKKCPNENALRLRDSFETVAHKP